MKKILAMAIMAVITVTAQADYCWSETNREYHDGYLYVEERGWDYGPNEMWQEWATKVSVYTTDTTEREELYLYYEHIIED
jgi:hypothetical protein